MKRQFLTDLGLDSEVVDKIFKEHGKTVNALKDELDNVEGYKSQIEELKEQVAERDKQLEELGEKAKGNDELVKEIESLKEQNEQTAKDFQDKLNKQTLDFKIEKALIQAKAKNTKAVKALLDLDTIELKDGEIHGLEEQLKGLQENDGYLFDEGQPAGLRGRTPHSSNPNEPKGNKVTKEEFDKMSYTEKLDLYNTNYDLYQELSK